MEEKIKAILEDAVAQIQLNLDAKGINASGLTSEGFRVIEYDGGIKLVYDGSGAPLSTLELGRPAGAIPMDFVSIIEQWSRDKGLQFADDKERRRFAGAVAFGKIKERGFGRPAPSDFGSSDATVYSDVVFETAKKLFNEIPNIFARYIKLN